METDAERLVGSWISQRSHYGYGDVAEALVACRDNITISSIDFHPSKYL